ncbi:MAG: hypothetical protein H7Z16_03305 [Pyrinomonadaceae bacterium]|nr:hypothetical protein [Pyrinomonadaceae bacterium]
MREANLFPDYPVVALKGQAREVSRATVVTPAIEQARRRVETYAQQWLDLKTQPDTKLETLINAVRGDYGTGKTHLLLDAAAKLEETIGKDYPDLTIIRVAGLETDRLNWFRLTIGRELNPSGLRPSSERGFVEQLMLRLYAKAGQAVAAKTKLTEAAVDRLNREPEAILTLIKENLLNVSAVDHEFEKLIEAICAGVSEDVRRALAGTVWIDTAAASLRWLAALPLREDERAVRRLSKDLSTDEDAAGVLIALAAIHRHLEIPFVLMIDELEHLTRFDKSQQGGGNITWLKRLLERLAPHAVLVFVSGYWSGWETQRDFHDRFTQLGPIELVKLTAPDVLEIVKKRVPDLNTKIFGNAEAEMIVQTSDGNIRGVLTLCRVLFRNTDGFRNPITSQEVDQAAGQIGQRLGIEAAALRVRAVLEQEGFEARAQAATATGIMFDVIGYFNDQPRIVVEIRHAVHQADLHDQAKVFLDRVEEVYKTTPDLVGCFIADGNIDDDLLAILKASRPFKLLWYDLTEPEVMTQLAADLRSYLHGGAGSPLPTDARAVELAARKNENQELMAQLEVRIKEASAHANAGLVTELQDQRSLVGQQIAMLNDALAKREADMRGEFIKSLKTQVEELDQKRNAELRSFYERLEAERSDAQSKREQEMLSKQEGEDVPKLHATYAELTRPPTLSSKLRLALSGPQLMVVFVSMVGGIALFFLSDTIAGFLARNSFNPEDAHRKYTTYRILFFLTGLLAIFTGLLLTWIRLSKVETFLNYANRTLREIYIRSQSVEDLIRADNILRDSLETFGLLRWKHNAEFRLWDAFERLLGPAPQHVIDRWRERERAAERDYSPLR